MKKDLVSQYIELFKGNKDFNLMMFGTMLDIFFMSIAFAFIYFIKPDRITNFLSFEVFGSILIGYFSYVQYKKLENKRKKCIAQNAGKK